jgi:hypothetical protein
VTGLHAEVRIPNLDALSLGVGDGHDQGYDTEHNQEQSGIQQHFHINILSISSSASDLSPKKSPSVQADGRLPAGVGDDGEKYTWTVTSEMLRSVFCLAFGRHHHQLIGVFTIKPLEHQ